MTASNPSRSAGRHVAQVDVDGREVVRRADEVAVVVEPDVEADDLVAGVADAGAISTPM